MDSNSKRIAINSLALYIRMFVLMIVSLYTTRIVLKQLGVTDYGIYNVVGGIVTFMAFVNSSLANATMRFITFELGKGNKQMLNKTFKACLSIHYAISIIVVLMAETIGLWLLSTKLNIPIERCYVAFFVFQISVLSVCLSIVKTPFHALLIAHEDMSIYSAISILETIIKLLVAIFLMFSIIDKLLFYAVGLLTINIFVLVFHVVFCKIRYQETSLSLYKDLRIQKDIVKFTGWTLIGNLAAVSKNQGISVIINMFLGPTANTARAIALQVESALRQFFSSFQNAIRPQITKSYASDDTIYFNKLIIYSSKYSFFLVTLLGIPVLMNIDYILSLWLGAYPNVTSSITKIVILTCIIYTLSDPLDTAIHATGDISTYQVIEGACLLLLLPIVYFSFSIYHLKLTEAFWIIFVAELVTQLIRMIIVLPKIKIKMSYYLSKLVFPILITVIPLLLMYMIMKNMVANSFYEVFVYFGIEFLFCSISIIFLGISRSEKHFIVNYIRHYKSSR